MLHTGPSAPIDRCFDKLSVRNGWEKMDQYLLIDGLGSNSNHTHSYPDALGIIVYHHLGESWIISENGSKFPEAENNTILTIVRKGEEFLVPSFAELMAAEEDDESCYIAMRLADYSKTDWTREVTMIRDVGLVVVDTVDIHEDGDYAISTHMRTAGKAVINGNRLYNTRFHEGKSKKLCIESWCSHDSSVSLHENNFELSCRNHPGEAQPSVTEVDIVAEWKRRYHTEDRVVSSMDSRIEGDYKKGDRITFVSLIYAQDSSDTDTVGLDCSDGLSVTKGSRECAVKTINPVSEELKKGSGKIETRHKYDGSLQPLQVSEFDGKS